MAVKTITAKITKAETNKGTAIITVEFDDGKGKWQKIYTQSQEVVVLADFKKMIEADIRKDLKEPGQLSEVTPTVGQTFTITI